MPGNGEALVKIEAAGICYGDLHPRDGGLPAPPIAIRPLVGGHEGVGHIVAMGNCSHLSSPPFQLGDRVGMGWRRSVCQTCESCTQGLDNICPKQIINGFETDGTFQEYVCLPVGLLSAVHSKTASAGELAPILCGGATALAAVRRAEVTRGNWVAVPGAAGGVGHLVLKYARQIGAKVLAIDKRSKEHFCRTVGVDAFVSYEDENMVQEIIDLTGGGVHASIVCSATSSAYEQAIQYSRSLSKIVAIGPCFVRLHTGEMMLKNLEIRAQSNGSMKDIAESLKLVDEGIKATVETVPIEQINEALDRLRRGEGYGRQVIVFE